MLASGMMSLSLCALAGYKINLGARSAALTELQLKPNTSSALEAYSVPYSRAWSR